MSLLFPQNFSNFLVLSLGTGQHRTRYLAKDAAKWGVINWLRHNRDVPLFSCLENASADMVDYNLSMMFNAHKSNHNYLRIQVLLVQLFICVFDSCISHECMFAGFLLLKLISHLCLLISCTELMLTCTDQHLA